MAQHLVDAARSDGVIYEIDLDNRSEYTTDAGWRHVKFYLSTKGDTKMHPAIASCSPYDVNSPYYDWDWKSNGGGYPEGTVAGDIARAAYNFPPG